MQGVCGWEDVRGCGWKDAGGVWVGGCRGCGWEDAGGVWVGGCRGCVGGRMQGGGGFNADTSFLSQNRPLNWKRQSGTRLMKKRMEKSCEFIVSMHNEAEL